MNVNNIFFTSSKMFVFQILRFQTIRNLGKIVDRRKSLSLTVSTCKCASKRNLSDGPTSFVSFDEIVQRRRAEAKCSIVVQVNSEKSYSELHGYCSKYADIRGMHHYKNNNDEHFILIEFTTEENLKDVIKACSSHQKDLDVMALQSPFLWFRAAPDKKQKYKAPEEVSLLTENADMEVNNDELYESLLTCNTVSDQIQMLYDKTALNDLGVRLRYIVARQIESLFESMYSNITVMPFGSTVNGFGKLGCDLDLVLTNIVTDEMCDPSKRLVFQEKRCGGGLRPWARHMELVGAALELRAAGAARVARVPQARVPIVQCTHHIASLDVDICYNNTSGVYMSELLWMLGSLDARVRPLVFAVRRWAQTVGLTNPHPGRWITNFPLTLLVLHFLQHKSKDGFVLPSVKMLVRSAGPADVRMAEDNVNCTFLRSAPPPRAAHSQSAAGLETLLLQFFEYYAQFDFQERAVSVYEGASVRKPSSQPLYIINPLEPALNVSKNVSYDECERLKSEVRNAAWQLEGAENQRSDREGWGLLALVERPAARGLKRLLRAGNSHRLLQVKDLFKEDDEDETPIEGQEGLSDKLRRIARKSSKPQKPIQDKQTNTSTESAKEKKEVFKFKNSQVAAEVFRIRRNKIV